MTSKTILTVQAELKAHNDEAREVLHTISTPAEDRAGDIVDPQGVQLDNYLKNPVVLIDHDYRAEKIIGKAEAITVQKDGISARTRFLDTPLGNSMYRLARAGIGGWSIGFKPVEFEARDDAKRGFLFKQWELLEYSLVAIPMNQDAVNNAIRRGLCTEEDIHAAHFPSYHMPAQDPPGNSAALEPNAGTVSIPGNSIPDPFEQGLQLLKESERADKIRAALRSLKT